MTPTEDRASTTPNDAGRAEWVLNRPDAEPPWDLDGAALIEWNRRRS